MSVLNFKKLWIFYFFYYEAIYIIFEENKLWNCVKLLIKKLIIAIRISIIITYFIILFHNLFCFIVININFNSHNNIMNMINIGSSISIFSNFYNYKF